MVSFLVEGGSPKLPASVSSEISERRLYSTSKPGIEVDGVLGESYFPPCSSVVESSLLGQRLLPLGTVIASGDCYPRAGEKTSVPYIPFCGQVRTSALRYCLPGQFKSRNSIFGSSISIRKYADVIATVACVWIPKRPDRLTESLGGWLQKWKTNILFNHVERPKSSQSLVGS